MDKPRSDVVIKRVVPPLAVWALKRLLETKRAKRTLQKVDARAYATRQKCSEGDPAAGGQCPRQLGVAGGGSGGVRRRHRAGGEGNAQGMSDLALWLVPPVTRRAEYATLIDALAEAIRHAALPPARHAAHRRRGVRRDAITHAGRRLPRA